MTLFRPLLLPDAMNKWPKYTGNQSRQIPSKFLRNSHLSCCMLALGVGQCRPHQVSIAATRAVHVCTRVWMYICMCIWKEVKTSHIHRYIEHIAIDTACLSRRDLIDCCWFIYLYLRNHKPGELAWLKRHRQLHRVIAPKRNLRGILSLFCNHCCGHSANRGQSSVVHRCVDRGVDRLVRRIPHHREASFRDVRVKSCWCSVQNGVQTRVRAV